VLTRTGWSDVADLGEPLAPMTGELPGLDAIGEDLAEAPKEFRRQLKIGGSRFFKPLMLYRWPWWLLIAGVAVGLWFAVGALIDHWGEPVTIGSFAILIGVLVLLLLIQVMTFVGRIADSTPIVVLKAIRNAIAGVLVVPWAKFSLVTFDRLFLRAGRRS
jgi:hypothetical protein